MTQFIGGLTGGVCWHVLWQTAGTCTAFVSSGTGFVQFTSKESAEQCLAKAQSGERVSRHQTYALNVVFYVQEKLIAQEDMHTHTDLHTQTQTQMYTYTDTHTH